jgi:hypothetical protein
MVVENVTDLFLQSLYEWEDNFYLSNTVCKIN